MAGGGCPHLRASLAPSLRFPLRTSLLPSSHRSPQWPDFAAGPTSAYVADSVDLLLRCECCRATGDADGGKMRAESSEEFAYDVQISLPLGTSRWCRCTVYTRFSIPFPRRGVGVTGSAVTGKASVLVILVHVALFLLWVFLQYSADCSSAIRACSVMLDDYECTRVDVRKSTALIKSPPK